jgi:hypothetical protein
MQRRLDMKKGILILVLSFLVLFSMSTLPGDADARDGFRGGIWIGPGWWGPSYYPYYPYYPYYEEPPVIIQQRPQIYDQPAPQSEQQSYWYFCTKTDGYYPYVKKCPGGWLKVVPPSEPPDQGGEGAPSSYTPDKGR